VTELTEIDRVAAPGARRARRRLVAALVAGAAGLALLILTLLGYAFDYKMTTSETEVWLLQHHGYARVECRHSYSLGVGDWDYYCRVYDKSGRYVWSPDFEVNGHEATSQTSP
jgi:hypothetical protein